MVTKKFLMVGLIFFLAHIFVVCISGQVGGCPTGQCSVP